MNKLKLQEIYREYLDCLNAQEWFNLSRFVHEAVRHNGRALGIRGYEDMLRADYEAIPDLRFSVELLVTDPPRLASRLHFDVTPKAQFLGLHVNGRRIQFHENALYEFRDGKILEVWSVLDKVAIEAQLSA